MEEGIGWDKEVTTETKFTKSAPGDSVDGGSSQPNQAPGMRVQQAVKRLQSMMRMNN